VSEKPKRLTSREARRIARCTRDFQWTFMEKCAEFGTLWFSPWNKYRREELPGELRCCLLTGVDVLNWMGAHPDWFVEGEWNDARDARPISLTAAGRAALANREPYDMEPIHGGLVEPGYIVTPAKERP
jgi:hypothetical protein